MVPARSQTAVRCADESFYTHCNAMIAMSDGVRLDGSLYVPKGAAGRLPVIVRQHGGGSNKDNDYDLGWGLEAVKTGKFALVMYSHRGHANSEGLFDFFGPRTTLDFSEVLDFWGRASDAIDTSNVGVAGYSQGGGESLLPAAFDGRVKAVAVGNTFNDLNQALNPNDCFKESIATAIFALAYKISASRTQDDLALRWGAQLNTDTEDVGVGPVPSTRDDLASRSPLTYADRVGAPVFWAQSWEDPLFPADMSQTYLSKLEARGIPVHYYFSSGGHFASGDYGPDLELKERSIIQWFEEFLLGTDHGFASGGRSKVEWWQRTGPGRPGIWEHHVAASWPPGSAEATFFPASGGKLATEPPADEFGIATVVNDFASANLAHDAAALTVADAIGMGDAVRSIPESPNPLDTATFTSEPLGTPIDVTGAPALRIPANTNPLRSQLSAKLWDVSSSGAVLVSRGCLSLEFEGIPYDYLDYNFTMWPNSHRFETGHRIMLQLSAVDMPTFRSDPVPFVTTILTGARLDLPLSP